MKMPPKEYTIRDVAADVGPGAPLEVIGGSPLYFSDGLGNFLTLRRRHEPVDFAKLDVGQVDRILPFPSDGEGQDAQRDLA